MSMLARLVPGVVSPTIGTASLVEVVPSAFADPFNYSYRVDVTITVSVSAPPGSNGYKAYVEYGPTNTAFTSGASSVVSLVNGVNNVQLVLNSNALASYYLRVRVASSDFAGNITIPVGSSNILQMPSRKKLYGRTYYDTQTSFTHPSGVSTYDVFFTSKGGTGIGALPSPNLWGGGGAGVRINSLTVDGDTYHIETRISQSSCYLRKTTAGNTSDQILANNGGNATLGPDANGTGASIATIAGFFAGGTLVANLAGQTGSTAGSGANEFGGRSGIYNANNPPYPGMGSSASGGLSGIVDLDGDGNVDFFTFGAFAFGCGGFGVFFPGGSPTYGSGQSGVVHLLYYE